MIPNACDSLQQTTSDSITLRVTDRWWSFHNCKERWYRIKVSFFLATGLIAYWWPWKMSSERTTQWNNTDQNGQEKQLVQLKCMCVTRRPQSPDEDQQSSFRNVALKTLNKNQRAQAETTSMTARSSPENVPLRLWDHFSMIQNHLVGKMSTNYHEIGMKDLEIKGKKKLLASAYVTCTSTVHYTSWDNNNWVFISWGVDNLNFTTVEALKTMNISIFAHVFQTFYGVKI